jgi:putative ABC transport system permease protein
MLDTLVIILELSCLYVPLMLGAYVNISLMKVPDLSIESAYVFGGIFGAKMLTCCADLPLPLALLAVMSASIVGGMIVGCCSSYVTRIAHVPHLLSSILTGGIFYGVNQLVLGGANMSLGVYKNPLAFGNFLTRSPELVGLVCIALLLCILGYYFLKTQLGFSLAIFGNNPNFFEHYGIASNVIFAKGIVLGNGLAGLSGYLIAQSSGFIDVNAGVGMALGCITALILGKTLVRTKKNLSILVPAVGTVVFCALQQVLLKIGCNQKYFTSIQAVVVLLILMYKYRHGNSSGNDNLGV